MYHVYTVHASILYINIHIYQPIRWCVCELMLLLLCAMRFIIQFAKRYVQITSKWICTFCDLNDIVRYECTIIVIIISIHIRIYSQKLKLDDGREMMRDVPRRRRRKKKKNVKLCTKHNQRGLCTQAQCTSYE